MYIVKVKTDIDYVNLVYGELYPYIESKEVTQDEIILGINDLFPKEKVYDIIEWVHSTTTFPIEYQYLVMKNRSEEASVWLQEFLDEKAQEYEYDNMMSARSYAGYENPFKYEALSLAKWASDCWLKAGEIRNDVLNGNRDFPSKAVMLAEMPVYIHL